MANRANVETLVDYFGRFDSCTERMSMCSSYASAGQSAQKCEHFTQTHRELTSASRCLTCFFDARMKHSARNEFVRQSVRNEFVRTKNTKPTSTMLHKSECCSYREAEPAEGKILHIMMCNIKQYR